MSTAIDQALIKERGTKKPARFPRAPLYGIFAMLTIAVALTSFGQSTGIGVVKDETGSPVAMRDIVFMTDKADVIHVIDLQTGDEISAYPSGEGGFVRGAQRALDRMRLVSKVPESTPYRLIQWDSGVLSLSDTGTGQRIYLNAFGPTNAAAFAALLDNNLTTQNKTAQAANTTDVDK